MEINEGFEVFGTHAPLNVKLQLSCSWYVGRMPVAAVVPSCTLLFLTTTAMAGHSVHSDPVPLHSFEPVPSVKPLLCSLPSRLASLCAISIQGLTPSFCISLSHGSIHSAFSLAWVDHLSTRVERCMNLVEKWWEIVVTGGETRTWMSHRTPQCRRYKARAIGLAAEPHSSFSMWRTIMLSWSRQTARARGATKVSSSSYRDYYYTTPLHSPSFSDVILVAS